MKGGNTHNNRRGDKRVDESSSTEMQNQKVECVSEDWSGTEPLLGQNQFSSGVFLQRCASFPALETAISQTASLFPGLRDNIRYFHSCLRILDCVF